jgi:hypothetical protein
MKLGPKFYSLPQLKKIILQKDVLPTRGLLADVNGIISSNCEDNQTSPAGWTSDQPLLTAKMGGFQVNTLCPLTQVLEAPCAKGAILTTSKSVVSTLNAVILADGAKEILGGRVIN